MHAKITGARSSENIIGKLRSALKNHPNLQKTPEYKANEKVYIYKPFLHTILDFCLSPFFLKKSH